MSEQYCRLFEIYEYSTTPKKTFEFTDEADQGATQAPIRLSYHNGNHYNSVFCIFITLRVMPKLRFGTNTGRRLALGWALPV